MHRKEVRDTCHCSDVRITDQHPSEHIGNGKLRELVQPGCACGDRPSERVRTRVSAGGRLRISHVSREFTKGFLVKGGLAICALSLCNCNTLGSFLMCKLKACLIAKPPFNERDIIIYIYNYIIIYIYIYIYIYIIMLVARALVEVISQERTNGN